VSYLCQKAKHSRAVREVQRDSISALKLKLKKRLDTTLLKMTKSLWFKTSDDPVVEEPIY